MLHSLFVYDLQVIVQEQSSPYFTNRLAHSGEELINLSRSWGQRSRSGSDDQHQNLVNFIAGEPLNGFGPNMYTNMYYTWGTV